MLLARVAALAAADPAAPAVADAARGATLSRGALWARAGRGARALRRFAGRPVALLLDGGVALPAAWLALRRLRCCVVGSGSCLAARVYRIRMLA